MILSAEMQNNRPVEIEFDFASRTWTVPPGSAKWGGALFSDRGAFEIKPWGSAWLLDGMGSQLKNSTVILHDVPTSEEDTSHQSGKGVAFAPALQAFKNADVTWKLVRRSAAIDTSGGSGALSKVRVKARTICEGILPKPGKLTNGVAPAGVTSGSGCGEFPGRVMRRMPVPVPPSPKTFYIDVPGAGPLHLAAPTTHWENFAKAIDLKYNPTRRLWVDFTGSNRPRTGDIYLLKMFTGEDFQHVGMIISAEGSEWVTADGGQGNKWQSGFMRRKFYPDGQIDGEFGNKARLKGWVDLDNLVACLKDYFPADLRP